MRTSMLETEKATGGIEVPSLGFGTFELDDDLASEMVTTALELGYRHIDTAQIYRNEAGVGRGLAAARLPREAVFLTTKAWTDHFADGQLQDSVKRSLDRLGTDYVDLLLLHWPNPDVVLEETIGALNEVQDSGWARLIGVSNFTVELLDRACELSDKPLAVNQVEYHPFLDQSAVLDAVRAQRMLLTAYSPLAQGKVFEHETLRAIAADHDRTPGQITLHWLVRQADVLAIPRSSRPEHAADNFDVFSFELSEEENRAIAALHHPEGRVIDPPWAPSWDS